jgi:hypothetical protein
MCPDTGFETGFPGGKDVMNKMVNADAFSSPGRGMRRRLRGAFSGKRGRRIGFASFVVPLAGYVIQDLRKPDSTIKLIARRAYTYLSERRVDRAKRIDPAGRVEIIDAENKQDIIDLTE